MGYRSHRIIKLWDVGHINMHVMHWAKLVSSSHATNNTSYRVKQNNKDKSIIDNYLKNAYRGQFYR